MSKLALLYIDVQDDFCPGGNLAVPEGNMVVPVCNAARKAFPDAVVVLSQDFHPLGHTSFASTHNAKVLSIIPIPAPDGSDRKVMQTMWPDHCVQGSPGANFCADFVRAETDIIIQKGMDQNNDSYSAFWDNGKHKSTGLIQILKEKGVTHCIVMGLAKNYCVRFSV